MSRHRPRPSAPAPRPAPPARPPLRGGSPWSRPSSCCSARSTACCPSPGCVIAATKSRARAVLHVHLRARHAACCDNIADLTAYRDGLFWQWMANTALYAGVGALLSTARLGARPATRWRSTASAAGALIFNLLLAGRAGAGGHRSPIPQYLLLAKVGLTDTYWSVLLPQHHQPVRHLPRPDLRRRRRPRRRARGRRASTAPASGGSSRTVALPMMVPGLVTVFLFQFVAIWNNFLLPYIMLGDDEKFPITRRACTRCSNRAPTPGALHAGDHRRAAVDHPADRALPVAAAVLAGRPRDGGPQVGDRDSRLCPAPNLCGLQEPSFLEARTGD